MTFRFEAARRSLAVVAVALGLLIAASADATTHVSVFQRHLSAVLAGVVIAVYGAAVLSCVDLVPRRAWLAMLLPSFVLIVWTAGTLVMGGTVRDGTENLTLWVGAILGFIVAAVVGRESRWLPRLWCVLAAGIVAVDVVYAVTLIRHGYGASGMVTSRSWAMTGVLGMACCGALTLRRPILAAG